MNETALELALGLVQERTRRMIAAETFASLQNQAVDLDMLVSTMLRIVARQ